VCFLHWHKTNPKARGFKSDELGGYAHGGHGTLLGKESNARQEYFFVLDIHLLFT